MTFKFNNLFVGRRRYSASTSFSIASSGSSAPTMPWKVTGAGGSLVFNGTSNCKITYTNSGTNFKFGAGPAPYVPEDFTIEWWQVETATGGAPRPWSFGAWPDTQLGISFEGSGAETTAYIWGFGGITFQAPVGELVYKSTHFALVRNHGDLQLFMNGVMIGDSEDNYNYNDITADLYIGSEGGTYDSQCFTGHITNFNIVKSAKYTANFTPTETALTFDWSDNVFLLPAHDETFAKIPKQTWTGASLSDSSIIWSNRTPFKYPAPADPSQPTLAEVSGGDYYTIGDYSYRAFNSSQDLVVSGGSLNIEYVLVAGGGGGARAGGGARGGGGGAGGLLNGTTTLAPNTYPITIGAGGVTGGGAAQMGLYGGETYAFNLTAYGGGGGGRDSYSGPYADGGPGGSGGGGGGMWTTSSGGLGTPPQGNEGGPGYGGGNAGGGGGAGSAGSNSSGGYGIDYTSWGLNWLGEGGGGANSGSGHVTGGTGGTYGVAATPAVINTGSGGGGGGPEGGNTDGSNGASGVVVIKYLTADAIAPLPSVTGGWTANDGTYYYTAFTASDMLTIANAPLNAEVVVVAGGGGGANGYAGGGGAGGLLHAANLEIPVGQIPVLIGAGGSSWLNGGYGSGYNGGDTYFGTLMGPAYGGGFGACFSNQAGDGGSGGGSGWTSGPAGHGVPGQGNDGAAYVYQGGGGGGYAAPGSGYQGGQGTSDFHDWLAHLNIGTPDPNGGYRWLASGGNSETSSYRLYGATSGWASADPNTGCGGGGNGISAASGGSGLVMLKYPMSSVSSVQPQ